MGTDIRRDFRLICGLILGIRNAKHIGHNMGIIKNFISIWKMAKFEETKIKAKSLDKISLAEQKKRCTEAHEPWVGIARVHVNPDDPSEGSFELEWNDIFVARLMKAGYKGTNEQEIVDSWFQHIAAGVASNAYEQEMADPEKRRIIQRRQLDDKKTEVS